MVSRSADSGYYPPGTVVSVALPLYHHVGIVTDRFSDGKPMVISNSKRFGCVVEESIDAFAGGNPVTRDTLQSTEPYWLVLNRARSRLGERYSLLSFNCEHFVRFAIGLTPNSPQITGATLILSLILLLRNG